MSSPREYRRRIRGVRTTRKITHAMELVAATKMRRAQHAAFATRRYAEVAWDLLQLFRQHAVLRKHPFLAGREPAQRRLVVVIAGNRGLVGPFHQRLAARAFALLRESAMPTDVVTCGRVAARLLQRAGVYITADFPKKDLLVTPEDGAALAQYLLEQFKKGAVDRVDMVSTDFQSTLRHEPRVRALLPVPDRGTLSSAETTSEDAGSVTPPVDTILCEPSPDALLASVVPNLVAIQVYQALLESTASEHAARMTAMQQATQNADELADAFTVTLNQARQQQITRELQEIVAGTLAA